MESRILYFFVLILTILLNLGRNTSYKKDRFFGTLLEKFLKFVPTKEDNDIVFHMSFVLLLAESDLFLKEQGRKEDVLIVCGSSHLKIVLALLTKEMALHMQNLIV